MTSNIYQSCPRLPSSLLCLSAIALLATAGGCGKNALAPRYFPLAPGYTWQYRVERTTMDGTTEMRHAVSSIAPPRSGSEVSAVRETLGGQRYEYGVSEAGIFRLTRDGDGGGYSRQLVFPATLVPGERWRGESRTSVLENTGPPWETLFRIDVAVEMEYRVEAVDVSLATAAGEFHNCVLISGQGNTNADVGNYIGHTRIEVTSREWFAPGVGLVRMERLETTAASALERGRLIMELDSFNEP